MESDRVRANTTVKINQWIDQRTEGNIRFYSSRTTDEISRRISELDSEWVVERALEAMAASFALTGLTLSRSVDRKWLLVPSVVLSFLLLHAIQGWCPPLPILRRLGFRTRGEIDRERFELKSLISRRDGPNPDVHTVRRLASPE